MLKLLLRDKSRRNLLMAAFPLIRLQIDHYYIFKLQCRSGFIQKVHTSCYLFIHSFVCLFIYLIYLFVCLFVCLFSCSREIPIIQVIRHKSEWSPQVKVTEKLWGVTNIIHCINCTWFVCQRNVPHSNFSSLN